MDLSKLSDDERREAERVFKEHSLGGLEEPVDHEGNRRREQRDLHQRAQAALTQANQAARRGDLPAAKHWTDTAHRMIAGWRALEEMPLPPSDEEEDARLREELRARLMKVAEGEHALTAWKMRREIWEEMAAEAARVGAPLPPPMPPRPPHWTDALPAEVRARLEEG